MSGVRWAWALPIVPLPQGPLAEVERVLGTLVS